MRRRKLHAPIVLLLLATACATVGSRDPLTVRAEDLLVNSLSIYSAAIVYHDTPGNSAKESREVYKAMEQVRVRFPAAWSALKDGVKMYKLDKNASRLQALIDTLEAVLRTIPVGYGGH